jgi:hypothetical protein
MVANNMEDGWVPFGFIDVNNGECGACKLGQNKYGGELACAKAVVYSVLNPASTQRMRFKFYCQ